MASASLTLYQTDAATTVFALVSQSEHGAEWRVANRGLGTPYSITLKRKLGAPGSLSNDHVTVTIKRVENNATTGKPATFIATYDLSIPRDMSIIDLTAQAYAAKLMGSLLGDGMANASTGVNVTKLVTGSDI